VLVAIHRWIRRQYPAPQRYCAPEQVAA